MPRILLLDAKNVRDAAGDLVNLCISATLGPTSLGDAKDGWVQVTYDQQQDFRLGRHVGYEVAKLAPASNLQDGGPRRLTDRMLFYSTGDEAELECWQSAEITGAENSDADREWFEPPFTDERDDALLNELKAAFKDAYDVGVGGKELKHSQKKYLPRSPDIPVQYVKCVKRTTVLNLVAASLVATHPLFLHFSKERIIWKAKELLKAVTFQYVTGGTDSKFISGKTWLFFPFSEHSFVSVYEPLADPTSPLPRRQRLGGDFIPSSGSSGRGTKRKAAQSRKFDVVEVDAEDPASSDSEQKPARRRGGGGLFKPCPNPGCKAKIFWCWPNCQSQEPNAKGCGKPNPNYKPRGNKKAKLALAGAAAGAAGAGLSLQAAAGDIAACAAAAAAMADGACGASLLHATAFAGGGLASLRSSERAYGTDAGQHEPAAEPLKHLVPAALFAAAAGPTCAAPASAGDTSAADAAAAGVRAPQQGEPSDDDDDDDYDDADADDSDDSDEDDGVEVGAEGGEQSGDNVAAPESQVAAPGAAPQAILGVSGLRPFRTDLPEELMTVLRSSRRTIAVALQLLCETDADNMTQLRTDVGQMLKLSGISFAPVMLNPNCSLVKQMKDWCSTVIKLEDRYIEKVKRKLHLTEHGRNTFFGGEPPAQRAAGASGSALQPASARGAREFTAVQAAFERFGRKRSDAANAVAYAEAILAELEARTIAELEKKVASVTQLLSAQLELEIPLRTEPPARAAPELQPANVASTVDALLAVPTRASDSADAVISKLVQASAAAKSHLEALKEELRKASPARAAEIALARLDAALAKAATLEGSAAADVLSPVGIKRMEMEEGFSFKVGVLNIAAAYPYDGGGDVDVRKLKLERAMYEACACKLDLLVVLELHRDELETVILPSGWDCMVAASSREEKVAMIWKKGRLEATGMRLTAIAKPWVTFSSRKPVFGRFRAVENKKYVLSTTPDVPLEFTVCALHLCGDNEGSLAQLELERLPSVLPTDNNLIIAGDWNLSPDLVQAKLTDFVVCHGSCTNLPVLAESGTPKVRDFFAISKPLLEHQQRKYLRMQQQAGAAAPDVASFKPPVHVLERDSWLRQLAEMPPAEEEAAADGIGCIPLAWLKLGLSELAGALHQTAGSEPSPEETRRAKQVNGFARSGWANHRLAILELKCFSK